MKTIVSIFLLISAVGFAYAQSDSTRITANLLADNIENAEVPGLATPAPEFPTLSGGVIGLRALLLNNGIRMESGYTTDVMSASSGSGDTPVDAINNFSLSMTCDMSRLMGWEGATLSLRGLGNEGATPGANAGLAQGVSNIESYSNWRLYTATISQEVWNGQVSLLVGLFDLNSEFCVTQNAGSFINPSFGIGYDIAQTGHNGPSIFPVTSLGFRIAFHPTESAYIQGVILDGVPGDLNRKTGTHIILSSNEGALSVTEAGLTFPDAAQLHIALGGWFYTNSSNNQFDETDAAASTNSGGYAIAEGVVYTSNNTRNTTVAIFGRYGIANDRINRFDAAYCGGVSVKNILQTADNAGIACTAVHNGSMFMTTNLVNGTPYRATETIIETYYQFQLVSWLTLQPDIQYVISPNSGDTPNVLVAGMRTQISL